MSYTDLAGDPVDEELEAYQIVHTTLRDAILDEEGGLIRQDRLCNFDGEEYCVRVIVDKIEVEDDESLIRIRGFGSKFYFDEDALEDYDLDLSFLTQLKPGQEIGLRCTVLQEGENDGDDDIAIDFDCFEIFLTTAEDDNTLTRLEFVEGTSSKFWQISVEDNTHTVTYGKIGTDGQSKTKAFDTEDDAQKAAEKLISSKRKKGYS